MNTAFDRAVGLLERALKLETSDRQRASLAEQISDMLTEIGDHEKGVRVLEPFHAAADSMKIARPARVRLLRRMGVHYHRAGQADAARAAFEQALRHADPSLDVEDLVFIDSELAEMHIFGGDHVAACEACERGLKRLRRPGTRDPFRQRMEVMLRASLGHVALRRLELERARDELLRALELGRKHSVDGDRAAILHNLGVTANQLSRFEEARGYFRDAESVLLRSGERRNVVKISTNLAVLAAKLGDRKDALFHLERASRLLREYPGQRLSCFTAYSRGVVLLLFGEVEESAFWLERAADEAEDLGDTAIRDFARCYRAEAMVLIGRYGDAMRLLRAVLRCSDDAPALRRVALSRLFALQCVLGKIRAAAASRAKLDASPPSGIEYLEAWNDVHVGFGLLAAGDPAGIPLQRAVEVFDRLGVRCGLRFARLGLLQGALAGGGDPTRLRAEIAAMAASSHRGDGDHRFLDVAEPLALAEAAYRTGEFDVAERRLAGASGAIVGTPFLELDWQLEFMRARLALEGGETGPARRHLHRCLHSRALLLPSVPADARSAFQKHGRFRDLDALEKRLRPARAPITPSEPESRRAFEGFVGPSPAMHELLETLERLREYDLPVLITGETGTGKELVARALHAGGTRRDRRLQTLHCACLPSELFEAELFGYEAGAFTSAERSQPGLLEDLEGGTLLLDDVNELPLESQAKLLRVLETHSIRRLGSREEQRIDVRSISSANTSSSSSSRSRATRAR